MTSAADRAENILHLENTVNEAKELMEELDRMWPDSSPMGDAMKMMIAMQHVMAGATRDFKIPKPIVLCPEHQPVFACSYEGCGRVPPTLPGIEAADWVDAIELPDTREALFADILRQLAEQVGKSNKVVGQISVEKGGWTAKDSKGKEVTGISGIDTAIVRLVIESDHPRPEGLHDLELSSQTDPLAELPTLPPDQR